VSKKVVGKPGTKPTSPLARGRWNDRRLTYSGCHPTKGGEEELNIGGKSPTLSSHFARVILMLGGKKPGKKSEGETVMALTVVWDLKTLKRKKSVRQA